MKDYKPKWKKDFKMTHNVDESINFLQLDFNAGDGVGINRQTKKGHWEKVAYVNTGAFGSTFALAQDLVDAYNEKHQTDKVKELFDKAIMVLQSYSDNDAHGTTGDDMIKEIEKYLALRIF